MKSYTTPHVKVIEIEYSSILAGSNRSVSVFSYHNSAQISEIRNIFAHMNSSLSLRQKIGLMAIMSNFAIQAGNNRKDVCKAFEFYLICIGLTESEISGINSKTFNTLDEMIACVKTIGNREVYENLILNAIGFVIEADNNVAWGMFEEVCEGVGYSESDVQNLLQKTQALSKHFWGE